MEYNFKEIEKKWQKYWKDHHIYQVKEDESNLIGIAGGHPVRESSEAFGNEILEYTMKTLISGIEKEYKEIKDRQN